MQTMTALYQPVNEVLDRQGRNKRGTTGTLSQGVEARIILDDDTRYPKPTWKFVAKRR